MNRSRISSILIVEDDGIIARDIASEVEGLGYRVAATVASEKDARRMLDEGAIDLVLMDVNLGTDRDGIQIAETVRQDYEVPVVFLTAHSDKESLNRIRAASPYGYILKPFNTHELEMGISIAMDRHELESRLHKLGLWLTAVIDQMEDAVVVTDNWGLVNYMNDSCLRRLLVKEEELLNRPFDSCFRRHDDGPLVVADIISNGKTSGEPVRLKFINRMEPLPELDGRFSAIKDDSGRLVGVVVVMRESG